jgi:ABC-2 type transport system permease protein
MTTTDTPSTDTGGQAPGYRAGRTLGFRVEFIRQLKRRRTTVMAAILAALPVLMAVAFAVGRSSTGSTRNGPPTLLDVATTSAANFAVTCLFVSGGLLVVIPIALFFGDTIASEASWSSLRYLLVAPVPRARMLRSKLLVALVFSFAALVLVPLVAFLVGTIAYGWGPLVLPTGGSISASTALARTGIVIGYLLVTNLVVAGLAFWLSTKTDAPLGAVGGALAITITGSILNQVDALEGWRDYLPAHWQFAWIDALQPQPEWSGMLSGVSLAITYSVVLFALAFRSFARADIVS